jgi:hypothetical protein
MGTVFYLPFPLDGHFFLAVRDPVPVRSQTLLKAGTAAKLMTENANPATGESFLLNPIATTKR